MSSKNLIAELNSPRMFYKDITFDWKESPYIFVGALEDFEDDQSTAAINMVYLGEKCLDFIEKNRSFGRKYRIELRPNKSQWNLYLHIDSVAWFDALINKCTDDERLNKARSYVDNVRNSYNPPRAETSDYEPVLAKQYCPYHTECVKHKKKCAHFHSTPEIYCDAMSAQKHRPNRPCNWYVENERIVPFDSRLLYDKYRVDDNDDWILTSRQSNVREILVFPLKHKTNKELVKSKSFWLWVFEDVVNKFFGKFQPNEYPVNCFALNFGEWESEESVDRYAINCHGHLHLQLKLELVKKMEEKFLAMRGKVDDPTHYGLKDCQELETSRLLSMENSRISHKLDLIFNTLELIKAHLKIPELTTPESR
ncbi:hypothetical protein C1646_677744 [Rhizophagus diaphanus]|nr:hypothetical protein C1646_677744 [Rhizophagus diaphanus] [Rhizophagus sp. MUCL 43196]